MGDFRSMAPFEDDYDFGPGGDAALPAPVNWNLLTADEAANHWRDLDAWVTWLKDSFGLPPSIIPPNWHRHDELIWELSALHAHFLACYDADAPPSGPVLWMRDFADARHRLRDWVAVSGTRLDRDRPTRRTIWPGEVESTQRGEVAINNRAADFDEFVQADLLRRRRVEQMVTGAVPRDDQSKSPRADPT